MFWSHGPIPQKGYGFVIAADDISFVRSTTWRRRWWRPRKTWRKRLGSGRSSPKLNPRQNFSRGTVASPGSHEAQCSGS